MPNDRNATWEKEEGTKKGVYVLGAIDRRTKKAHGTSSHHINIVHPWARSPALSQHLVPMAQGDMEVRMTLPYVN